MKERKDMKKIKSFIYLDNYKMYSISSQLFEGLTEYIVKSESRKESETNEQKGNFGTGRLMADIIESESDHTEKKFLHHYSYNLFEDELIKEGRVLSVSADNIDEAVNSLADYNFVKITNQMAFNDAKHIVDTFTLFNKIGESIMFLRHQDRVLEKEAASQSGSKNKHNQQKSGFKTPYERDPSLLDIAKSTNLHLDPTFIESLLTIVRYGYTDAFEAQIPFITDGGYYLFSSLLDRELLTESELSITKKYSRETEKEFTLFGILTQVKTVKEKISLYKDVLEKVQYGNTSGMKEAIMALVTSLTDVEKEFVGKLEYEFIVDPIAIYREL